MKVIEVPQFGGVEVLHLIDEPDPALEAGQVRVEVKASGINFADLMARAGVYPGVPEAPFRPGFEVAGLVTALGDGVTEFHLGDRVIGLVPGGGYAASAAVDAPRTFRLPDTLEFAPATALLVQGLTAYFLLEAGDLQAGQTVLIPGAAGGVGSLAVQIAKLKGAGKVIGLASPSKHDLVTSLGADAVFDYTQAGWSKQVVAETGGAGVNIFLDSQGDVAGEAFDVLSQQAHWLVYGSQADRSSGLPAERLWTMVGKNITLRGFTVYSAAAEYGRGIRELIGWVTDGTLKLSVQRFPLAEAARAHEAIAARQTTGKVVLEP